ISAVSAMLTAARPHGPFSIGAFSEENAHWVAFRVGSSATTRLLHGAGMSAYLVGHKPKGASELGAAILQNWDTCKQWVASWSLPDTKRIDAEIIWESHQAEKHRRQQPQVIRERDDDVALGD